MAYSPGELQSSPALPGSVEKENKARLELLYEVSRRIGSVPRMTQMLEQVIRMTQHTLNASAASILLFRNNDNELLYQPAFYALTESIKSSGKTSG